MSRRKPRFTPDPPPYGASNEQILVWVNAQLQRIEDYWPRDDGDRITALEELQSKYSGEWSISGQSLIRFEGSIAASAATICDYDYTEVSSFSGPTNAIKYGSDIEISDDGLYLVMACWDTNTVRRFSYNGSSWSEDGQVSSLWTGGGVAQFITMPQENKTILFISDAKATVSGTSEAGRVLVYNGSFIGGWSYDYAIEESTPVSNGRFSSGLGVSGDGTVLGVGTGERDTLVILEYSGSSWVERDRIYRDDGSTGSGLGFGARTAFNSDGSVMIVSSPVGGVGSSGEVYVYDWNGSSYVERQEISAAVPGTYAIYGDRRFGSDLKLAEDGSWLAIADSGYADDASSPTKIGATQLYKLNTSTNEYDWCKTIQINSGSALGPAIGRSVDVVFNRDPPLIASGGYTGPYLGKGHVSIAEGSLP